MDRILRNRRTAAVRRFVFCLLAALLLPSSAYEPMIRLVFLGDIMLGRGVAEAHARGDWETTLHSLSPVTRAADLALANLESPFDCETVPPADPHSLAAPPDAAAALSSAGLDVLSTVNNHSLDAGPRGRKCTEEILSSMGILALDTPSAPMEIRIRGIDLRLVAFDFTGEVTGAAIDGLERSVRDAPAGAVVVVSLHWGMEYQSGHDEGQRRIAGRLASLHADILWGHHPHVVQEMEWLDGTLILYSLGNAVFDQQEPASVRRGEMVWVEVDRRGIRSVAVLPFTIDPRLGRIKALDLLSLRFSVPPSQSP